MRKKLKIIALLLVSLIMVIALTNCTDSVSNIKWDNKSDTPVLDQKGAAQTSIQPKFFFINGTLIGSYNFDGWHSLCDTIGNYETHAGDSTIFYAKDLLNQDFYYVYDSKKLLGISKQIIWFTEEAFTLGSFEDADAPAKFAIYGRPYNSGRDGDTTFRIFDLPVKLGDELSKLEIPNYSFRTQFVLNEKPEPSYSNYELATNSSTNLFPKLLTYDAEPTVEGIHSLIDLFKENDMENTIPNFTDCISGDFDGDSKDEYLMIANSPEDENGWPIIVGEGKKDKVGIFSAMLYEEDKHSVQILYNEMSPIQGTVEFTNGYKELSDIDYNYRINFATAADLNGNGIYEIVVLKTEWEGGYTLAFSQNEQGVYSVVMRSNWGL